MNYCIIPVTHFFQNCSLIWCKWTKLAALVDPGGDSEKIKKIIIKSGVTLIKILLTHGHIDHVGSASELSQFYNVPIIGPGKEDKFWLQKLPIQSKMFNFNECQPLTSNHWLSEGESINIGHLRLQVLHCPGHSPGHVAFLNHESNLLISGDIIFKGSIGRTDFPRSNHNQLIRSIKKKILPLNNVMFIPGHGPTSTIIYEKIHNLILKKEINI